MNPSARSSPSPPLHPQTQAAKAAKILSRLSSYTAKMVSWRPVELSGGAGGGGGPQFPLPRSTTFPLELEAV